MGRYHHGVPPVILPSLALLFAGCGSTSSGPPPPPPPAVDFTLSLSANSVSVTQGGASPAVNISVNPVNGFSGSVQVTLNTLPAGVTSNPASTFSVTPGANTAVVFGASANAATGTFVISVQGTSANLSHSDPLSVAVQGAVNSALPRTAYVRTDSTSASDDPFGEPHHRHIAYDPANKHVFIANRALNRVEVFSTTSQARVAQISVPGASSVADFGAQNVYLLDPVKGMGTTVPVGGMPGFTNSGPARVAATSIQTVFVGLNGENGSSGACSSCLAQMNLTASPPTIQVAPQPEVTSLTGAPLVQGSASGNSVFVAFGSSPGGPVAVWNASAPNQFVASPANASTTDLGAAGDGTMFAVRTQGVTEIRDANPALTSIPSSA
jgi:hypothetical protein